MSTIPTIYGLCDPVTGELRYIGKTVNLKARIRDHMNHKLTEDNYKSRWLRTLPGLPKVVVLEETDADQLNESEQFHIAYFRSIGARLTNLTIGGDGFDSAMASKLARSVPLAIRKERGRRAGRAAFLSGVSARNNLKLRKPIVAINLETGEERWYLSACHASKDGLGSRSAIANCLRPSWRCPHNKGWTFRYVPR